MKSSPSNLRSLALVALAFANVKARLGGQHVGREYDQHLEQCAAEDQACNPATSSCCGDLVCHPLISVCIDPNQGLRNLQQCAAENEACDPANSNCCEDLVCHLLDTGNNVCIDPNQTCSLEFGACDLNLANEGCCEGLSCDPVLEYCIGDDGSRNLESKEEDATEGDENRELEGFCVERLGDCSSSIECCGGLICHEIVEFCVELPHCDPEGALCIEGSCCDGFHCQDLHCYPDL